jgi:hypothetical protein
LLDVGFVTTTWQPYATSVRNSSVTNASTRSPFSKR